MKRVLLSFLLTAQLNATAADSLSGPPRLPNLDDVPSTVTSTPSSIRFGSATIELEHTTLDQFRRMAGAGEIHHRGDAGDSEYWLCYTMGAGQDETRIFLSSTELGGDDHAISSIDLVSVGVIGRNSDDCPRLRPGLRPFAMGGISMGTSLGKARAALGQPSSVRQGWMLYGRNGKSVDNVLDQISVFGFHLRRDRIDRIFVSRASTN